MSRVPTDRVLEHDTVVDSHHTSDGSLEDRPGRPGSHRRRQELVPHGLHVGVCGRRHARARTSRDHEALVDGSGRAGVFCTLARIPTKRFRTLVSYSFYLEMIK